MKASRKLILVKHSLPQVEPGKPAREWMLGEEGKRRSRSLADGLKRFNPALVVTSVEPKAAETGEIIAAELGIPCAQAENLHEHERGPEDWADSREEFEARVARFFSAPGKPVFGRETAEQAYQRFSRGIAAVVEGRSEGNIVVVAHGTVISLFVGRRNGIDPFPLWLTLGLPSYAVVSLPRYTLMAVAAGES